MQVYQKIGDEVILLYNPSKEEVIVGENLLIADSSRKKGILVQVFEQNLVELPGILEELIRKESLAEMKVQEHVPEGYQKFTVDLKNMKFARARVRKEVDLSKEEILDWSGWVPDRSSEVKPIDDEWILDKLKIGKGFYKNQVYLGRTNFSKYDFYISAYNLQGITIVVGKKGTGKSHLTKSMLLGLVDLGAIGIVFDINDEYSPMTKTIDGEESSYSKKLITLDPGKNLKFTLDYVGRDVFIDVLTNALELRDASTIELMNIWDRLVQGNRLSFQNLFTEANRVSMANVRSALTNRLNRVRDSKLFVDDSEQAITIEEEIEKITKGGALIINLKAKNRFTIYLVVQTILSKIERLLEEGRLHPIFFFAEEAHTYFPRTNWVDVVTRMRHLGAYQIYITNTPTELDDIVIRQADNLFAFHLSEPKDITHIAPAAKLEVETIEKVVKSLPPKRCLVIGRVTEDYPFIIDVRSLEVQAAGETKRFFKEL
jgi:hypothetical protein